MFSITLSTHDNRFNLTNEGFAEKRDARQFATEAEALEVFHSISEASLVLDGFDGFHTCAVTLTEWMVDADEEVTSRIVAEKQVTVSTVVA